MKKFYYELSFKTDKPYEDLFLDFIFDLGIEAIEEKDGFIFIRSDEDLENLSWALELFHKKLSKLKNTTISFEKTLQKKENKDWIEEYKKNIKAISIDKVYIHTTWQNPRENFINIKIDPALAFGSGHHESTYSCIKLLQKFAKENTKALDLGCGSGILAMVLARLGLEVDLCDTDELAVQSALANAQLNGIKFHRLWRGSINKADSCYDLLVANLVADIILLLDKNIKEHLKENAILILAGILDKYELRVKEKFQDLKLVDRIQMNEWVSLVYKKG